MILEAGQVWAPGASSVELVADGVAVALADDRGFWGLERPALDPGVRYGFRLDGGDVLPDPRSRWQPDGPEGLSAVDDPSAFEWTGGWAWAGRRRGRFLRSVTSTAAEVQICGASDGFAAPGGSAIR